MTTRTEPALPFSCIAFDSRVRADIELPGAEFEPERPPARELRLQQRTLRDWQAPLERRLVSSTGLTRNLILRTSRAEPPAGTPRHWALEAEGAATFAWAEGSAEIWWDPGPEHSRALFGFLFLHSFLPAYFTINRSYHVLHAGAVEVDGRTLVFLAPSMGGKSTLTDFFVNRGHKLLSDDKLATFKSDEDHFAVGAYPFLRPYREAEALGEYTPNFASAPRRIHAVFLLDRADPGAAPKIEPLLGMERFRRLAGGRDILLKFRAETDFDYLAGMANRVALFRLDIPWSLDRLPDTYACVTEHVRRALP